jgi:hypothetical protein
MKRLLSWLTKPVTQRQLYAIMIALVIGNLALIVWSIALKVLSDSL